MKNQLAMEVTKLGETEKMLSCVKSVLYKTENEKQEKVIDLISTSTGSWYRKYYPPSLSMSRTH